MAVAVQDWLQAQHGVLGSCLISPEIVPKILFQVSDADFSGKCVAVFQAIRAIFSAGQTVDVITVRDKLGDAYTEFLMQLMEITPTAANYQTYVDLAKKQSRFNRLQEIGQQMADADDPQQMQELLSHAVAINSARQGIRAVTIQQAVDDFIISHDGGEKPDYHKWPIVELNDQLYIDHGDFLIIGGKPSAGKTAFALQCAFEQSKHKRVGFFSLETGVKKLTHRQIAASAGVPLENIKRDAMNQSHWDSVVAFRMSIEKSNNLEIIAESGLTVSDIQAFSAARGYDIVYIDYLQLLQGSGYTRYEQITNISLDLHRFSQSTGCTVIALSQLSRDSGQPRGKKDPDMGSLRESGQLEQDADAILLLYLENDKVPNGRRILRCAKNKEGERFRMLLDFDGKTQTFIKSKDYGQFRAGMAAIDKERKAQERLERSRQLQILPPDTPVPDEFAEA